MAHIQIGDLTPRNQYTATSGQTAFAYSFPIFDDSDIVVYIGQTLQTLTTDYTVSGAGDDNGGTVTLVTGATSGDIVTIYRDIPVARTSDYQTNGDFLANTVNDDFDKLIAMVQQLEYDVRNRTLRFGQFTTGIPLSEFTENATDRANKILGFDSSGDPNITQELGTYKGNWASSTIYVLRDIVKDTTNNNIYICTTAHTSSASFSSDTANWALIVDAASATSSASAAATSATAAASSATAAANSASAASTSETNAATSASTATTQASNASTSATAAASSATAAAASASAAETYADNFDDAYLGAKATDPSVDNDGDALADGALYFDTTNNVMKVYDLGSTTWYQLTPTVSNQTNINTVAGIASDVSTVAGISSDVTTVSGISANTTTVAGISSNVTTVAGISSAVSTVATNNTNVSTVATNIANVNTVGGISANVTTVAGISSDVTAVAGDATDIGTVAGLSTEIGALGAITSDITTAASNVTDITNFADVYVGPSATAPTTRADSSALQVGDLYFDTANSVMKVYSASGWVNASSSVNGTANSVEYTATSGQTVFNATYDAGYVQVYLNGVRLDAGDYTATNGTSITLNTGATAGDTVFIQAFGTFEVANFSIDDANDVNTAGVTNGQALIYNSTSGDFEAGDVATGNSAVVGWENQVTVAENYTITTNYNMMSAGPITIDTGYSVTVPTGSTWTIV